MKTLTRAALILLLYTGSLIGAVSACADDMPLAYLHINELSDNQYRILWKLPAQVQEEAPNIHVLLEGTPFAAIGEIPSRDGYRTQWGRLAHPNGFAGAHIAIEGLTGLSMEVLIHLQNQDQDPQFYRLSANNNQLQIPLTPSTFQVITTYFHLGIEHILLGLDHLLFVLVLVLLVVNKRQLLLTITAFTLAHSITLSLAALALIYVPVPPVEAAIALSILFAAAEVVRNRRGHVTFTARYPWLMAFVFGLLHGLGFAAALADIGLPQSNVPTALLFFNIGVEVGQLCFVAALVISASLIRQWARPSWHQRLNYYHYPLVYCIGSAAAFWTIERTFILWPGSL